MTEAPVTTAGTNNDPARPAAVKVTNVPVVPDDLRESLRRFQQARGAAFRGWHPQGDGMLIGTRFGNTSQLHRVLEAGGRRAQITFQEEPVGGYFIPKAKDGAIILSMSQGGNENSQLFLFTPEDGKITLLTDGTSKNNMGPFTPDGKRLIYSSNKRNGKDTDIYIMDPRNPSSEQMLYQTDGEYWWPADVSPDGKRALMARFVSITETHPAILNLETGTLTPLPLPSDEPAYYGDFSFAPDGEHIFFASDVPGEFRQLAKMNLDSYEIEWLTADIPWDVESVIVDENSDNVAFITNEDGLSGLYLLKGDKRRKVSLPEGIVWTADFSPDSKELGLTVLLPTAPADVYSLNLKSEKLTRWTYSEVGGLNTENFIAPKLIRYASFDGLQVPAFVSVPKEASASNPVPVIIDIHGGPESQYRPYFSSIDQFYLSEMGVAVIHPNVRGSTGYGKTFTKLDNQMKREDSVKDIGHLLDWIEGQPELDSSRVAVTGGSYGGYMVLASLFHFPERLRAGICVVGISNFITFLENTSPYRVDLRRTEYGDERDPEMRAHFEKINPTANAHKITSDLMLAHGVNDPRVPVGEAMQIAEIVRENNVFVAEVYAENEGHGFSKKDNRDYITGVQVHFLKERLVGKSGE